jgi:hypothetical protein
LKEDETIHEIVKILGIHGVPPECININRNSLIRASSVSNYQHIRTPQMELELHVARFFFEKKSKMALSNFKKFRTKNLDVDNYEIY